MKNTNIILSALVLLLLSVSTAQAVTCANGVYRAGCVGPNGAVGVNKYSGRAAVVAPPRGGAAVIVPPRGGAVVVNPANCAWVNGRKVCR
jgi:hypothetical protein